MTLQMTDLTEKTGDMLGILERDSQHLEKTMENLNALRVLVIKRDEKGLGRLLEAIQLQTQVYANNEQQRNRLRREMAELIGVPQETMNLTVLKNSLTEPELAAQVGIVQQKLKTLTMRLKREYATTVTLLSECARINTALLKCIFNRNPGNLVCYDSAGAISRQTDATFMSMRL